MSDNANLLDIAVGCKVGRFERYFMDISAVLK